MGKKTAVAICWFWLWLFSASAQTIPDGVVASAGGVDVVFIRDTNPLQGGLIRGTLRLQSSDGTTITGFHDLQLEKLHQVGTISQGVIYPYKFAEEIQIPWAAEYDSYLLPDELTDPEGHPISSSSFEKMFWETGYYHSSAANPADIVVQQPAILAAYRGNWHQLVPFSLSPEDQGSTVDLAQLVGIPGERTSIRLGVVGEGFDSCSDGSGACFEFDLDWGEIIANERPQISSNILDVHDSVIVGSAVTLSASVSDDDGSVDLVEFVANDRLIPNCAFGSGPFTCRWAPPVGEYTLAVRAVDDRGDTAYSPTRRFEVLPEAQVTSQHGMIMSRGGVDVVFAPDGSLLNDALIGGTLSLQSDEGARIVTFGDMSFQDVHQIALATPVGAFVMPSIGEDVLLSAEQARYDSHLLIGPQHIGGQAGGQLTESGLLTSPRDPAGVEALIEPSDLGSALAYLGDLVHPGAFFILPEFQVDSIDLARLVGVPGTSSSIRFDVLGFGFLDCGSTARPPQGAIPSRLLAWVPIIAGDNANSGACFDFTINWGGVLILDFDADGKSTADDLDALVEALVSGETGAFDLTGDGIVDLQDLEQWLRSAAEENGFSEPYLFGDGNLDGRVDVADLNALAKNWLGHSGWQGGDFAPDGQINEDDLNLLGENWQGSIPPSPAPLLVPESALSVSWLGWMLLLLLRRHIRQ